MSKVIFNILIISIIFSSCNTEDDKMIGHWHEYTPQSNGTEFNHCIIITDSTFAVDKYTMGGVIKKSDYEGENFWTSTYYPEKLIAKRLVKKNEVIFGDSFVWKRQKNDLNTLISDFSAGIMLNITPFETKNSKFEKIQPERIKNFIYVGKIKSEFLENDYGLNGNQYYLQLNDKISSIEDIRNFLLCYHCEYDIMDVYINAHQNVPKSYLERIENEISKIGINLEEQVFYLYMNKDQLKAGYKKTTANNVYN